MGHLARQSDQIPFAVSILVNLPFLSISPHFDSSLTPICHFLQFLQKIDIKQLVWQVFYGLWSSYGKRLDKSNRAEIMALEEVVASIREIPMMAG